ncbi:putative tRNA 4-demethylwyosine synthase KNAG_0D01110 [Huiozyma naganishii CBS 8797]|uniref:S-adenosyl-L-methionine-dependent tRNA 4-demethylwyosine synthase n=1 Tax=Huiozyma naganishii (strain ATCC MYA-139 / BCRC 22969 / CBS 8797 / KCTC 17520 / NBRC 10181 / NCYC 3082 / Yp74L-3) TaxID=1071383 RepID=J7RK31_HUIN7|nr:hypothetical protein KNAG_0D01110 [Kazachstania naganishii CBS 8797]CCK69863.1 hypothetical protein KNAG_0D01110 [Kazachstania naganishii CBS 8797]
MVSVGISAVLAAAVGVYLYFGGRISIAIVIIVSYAVFCSEQNKQVEDSGDKPSDVPPVVQKRKEKHVCACKSGGGGGGGSCCSSKGGKSGGGSCCSSKGAKSGDLSGKKVSIADELEIESLGEQISEENKKQLEELTIDFTDMFTKEKKSTPKPLSSTKSTKRFTKGKRTLKKEAKQQTVEFANIADDGLIKSAFTVSNEKLMSSDIYVFYSSLQGASVSAAEKVVKELSSIKELQNSPTLINLDELDDVDQYFLDVPTEQSFYILVLPSYDVDCPLDYFLQILEETYNDFRVDRYPLRKLVGYTVLGLGDRESYPEKFCYQAKKADFWLSRLGARRMFPLGEICVKFSGLEKVDKWSRLLGKMMLDDEPILYEYDETVDNSDDEEEEDNGNVSDEGVVDVEDLTGKTDDDLAKNSTEVKQMIAKNSPTYKNLTKQGYKIVGSHSGVKVCRWTKNELRGKGSCYKKSLFNIASSRCMELTPSLACSSKCVFCWRHGTNPVSKNWRWETDDPQFILENALEAHYSMIKQMRGVPGIIADRFAKAFQVAHCALSLVGEPILYPHITRFIELLHQKHITSFLVCNAQHPESLRTIGKVTQLYVSIDAPTKGELQKVDRPLYKDFWERMMECLDIIKTVQSHQRTVYRLTLVKGFNMGDIISYADLVERGLPCFIEVKGATFSGTAKDSVNALTMQNIPYLEECKKFVESFVALLQSRGLKYEIAAEHSHSNCVLIAHEKFKIDGEWHTHIDFDKFFEKLESGEPFTYMDYLSKTPEWALYGNGGFAPGNVRVIRKDKKLENKLLREQQAVTAQGVTSTA